MGGGGQSEREGGRGKRVDKVRGWGRGRGAARERGGGQSERGERRWVDRARQCG